MLVCTLPSPACMCSATNTRLCSTRWWMRVAARRGSAEGAAVEDLAQRLAHFASSTTRAACGPAARGNGRPSMLQLRERRAPCQRARVSGASRLSSSHCQRLRTSASSCLRCIARDCPAARRRRAAHRPGDAAAVRRRRIRPARRSSSSLLLQRQLDVDALDAVGVVAQARQRDHHVLVDLERVGVLGDRRGARAVEPELLARLGGHRDEAFAAARVGDAHDLARRPAPTASSSSPTMSPSSTIFGRPPRLALVA